MARKNVQKITFKAAEMILGPWNQQVLGKAIFQFVGKYDESEHILKSFRMMDLLFSENFRKTIGGISLGELLNGFIRLIISSSCKVSNGTLSVISLDT